MTITDGLAFDLLASPVAAIDRRALSQAWYSALYRGANHSSATIPRRVATAPPQRTAGVRSPQRAPRQAIAPRIGPGTNAAARAGRPDGMPEERRAPASPLTRALETRLRRLPQSGRRAFTLRTPAGRVHVLVHARGGRLTLVALCGRGARPDVAAALNRARYALASRGITVETAVREASAW